MTTRLKREVTRLLEATGKPFEFVANAKHEAVFLAGAKIATISNGGNGRDTLKIKSAIRTRLRELGE